MEQLTFEPFELLLSESLLIKRYYVYSAMFAAVFLVERGVLEGIP